MKSIVLLLGFLAFILPVNAEPPVGAGKPVLTDFEIVRTADCFSIGPTGAGAAISTTETSFRRILQTPTAAEDCRKLTTTGTPAGQLYGLLGMKHLKDPTYETTAARYRFSRVVVSVTNACDISRRPTFFVVQLIEGKVQMR